MTATAGPVSTAPVLAVDGVTKAFRTGPPWHRRRNEVLRGASLEVRPGELVGLVGENGSGKSTLMQVIVGLLGHEGGSVVLASSRSPSTSSCSRRPTRSIPRRPRDRATRCWTTSASPRTWTTGSRRCPTARVRSSTWRWRSCTSRGCCSTSRTPAPTGRPTCASGRWPSAAAGRAWASSSSATCSPSASGSPASTSCAAAAARCSRDPHRRLRPRAAARPVHARAAGDRDGRGADGLAGGHGAELHAGVVAGVRRRQPAGGPDLRLHRRAGRCRARPARRDVPRAVPGDARHRHPPEPDVGDGTPGGLAAAFPDYGANRIVIDGAFSPAFHAWSELGLALGWLALLALAVAGLLRRLLGGTA